MKHDLLFRACAVLALLVTTACGGGGGTGNGAAPTSLNALAAATPAAISSCPDDAMRIRIGLDAVSYTHLTLPTKRIV